MVKRTGKVSLPARLVALLFSLCATALCLAAETPAEAFRAFIADCQSHRTQDARSRLLIIEGNHPEAGSEHADQLIQSMAEFLPPDQKLMVLDSHEDAAAAVLLVRPPNQRLGDAAESIYLVNNGQQWKLLPTDNQLEDIQNLTPDQKRAISSLKAWAVDAIKRLQQDAKPEAKSQAQLVSSLIIASARGNTEEIDRLIAQGADVNAVGQSRKTPLQVAAESGKDDVIRKLIAARASVDPPGESPLMLSLRNRHADTAILMIKSGADINRQREGSAPLELATWEGLANVVKALLDKGARPRDPTEPPSPKARVRFQTQTPPTTLLNIAAASGDYATFELIRPMYPDPRVADPQGLNALHAVAAMHSPGKDRARIAQELLKAGVDPHAVARNADGRFYEKGAFTPLQSAAVWGNSAVVLVLLAEVKYPPDQLTQVMYPVAYSCSAEVLAKLIECGASTQVPEGQYSTPLHAAILRCDPAKVRYLLDHGAPIGYVRTDRGRTALLDAVAYSTPEIVSELLKRGADPKRKDAAGQDAASLARLRLEKGREDHTGESYLPEFPQSPNDGRDIATLLAIPVPATSQTGD